MNTIYLHIGQPKTGTSVQTFLRKNAHALRERGYHVPLLPGGKMAHHAMARMLAGLPVPRHLRTPPPEFLRDLAQAPAVLLSAEVMSNIFQKKAAAARMIAKLRSTGAQIVFVMYVRNQPQLLNSGYTQHVKTFKHCGAFTDFVRNALSRHRLRWDNYVSIAQGHGIKLEVRPYSRAVRERGIVPDFCETVGIPADGLSTPKRVNEGTKPFAVEVARRVVDALPEVPGDRSAPLARACRAALDEAVVGAGLSDPRYCGLDTDLARTVEDDFAGANDRLAHFAWGRPWGDVFADDVRRTFAPNDYRVSGVPAGHKAILGRAVDEAVAGIRAALQ